VFIEVHLEYVQIGFSVSRVLKQGICPDPEALVVVLFFAADQEVGHEILPAEIAPRPTVTVCKAD